MKIQKMLGIKTQSFTFSELENILIEFSISILGKKTEEELVWDLAKNCISKLGFVDCVIYFVDHEKKLLIQRAAHGIKNPVNKEIHAPLDIPLGKGISGAVAVNGKGEIVNDTSADDRYIIDFVNRLSEIAIPISIDDEVFGVIDCEHPEKGYFNEQHFRILSAISSIFAIKLDGLRKDQENKKKEEILLSAQKEMLTLKAKALRAQMNPHFVFNSLNAIQHFITTNDKRLALKYLSIFSKLVRYILSNSHLDTIFLTEEIRMLEWYLKLQQLRYEDRFNYVFKADKTVGMHVQIPSLMLPILIENAIESTVKDRDGNGKIYLSILPKNGIIEILLNYNATTNIINEVDYRDNLASWEDQLDALNSLRDYGIKKTVNVTKVNNNSTVTIALSVPILE